ncbi:kinase-like protein [Hesseltinella vesiculosa]|uniref:Kinase-like protein n=1 Tax=Hesseltinella vesiculosa TaxID=101127 RepID=A0A1X2GM23_9FUNG|nr:kinase-like protein [Hesseltinella vesiculosa]
MTTADDATAEKKKPAERLAPQLPSGLGNSLQHVLDQEAGSNASSQYNSDADEPAPRPRKSKQVVELEHDYADTEVATPRRIGIQDFELLRVLGRGAFGKVYLVQQTTTKQLYAMKVLKKASLVVEGKQADQIKTERQILTEVRHPFIVKLHYAFQTAFELHMVLQYAVGGELWRHLNQEGMFSEATTRFYAAELILALDHLHSLGIIYRDLKPENCLLDTEGHVVLTDFGLSKVAIDGKATTLAGTVQYLAPEILLGLSYDDAVDWWSFGILLFDMMTGSPPFTGSNNKKIMDSIVSKKIHMPYYLTSSAKDLLNKLLRKNPNARLGAKPKKAAAVRRHDFFSKIHWKDLEQRKVAPPIRPVVTDPVRAENFDDQFTNEPLRSSSTAAIDIPSANVKENHFQNFSFVRQSLE